MSRASAAPAGAALCDRLCFPDAAAALSRSRRPTEALLASATRAGLDDANRFFIGCAVLASIGMGIQSFNGNFTAPTLALNCSAADAAPALNCELKLSEELVSYYAAATSVTAIFGAFVGGAFVDRVGRKRMMLLATLPYIAGWVLTALTPAPPPERTDANGHAQLSSPTVLLLFGGRLLQGFGGGLSIPGIGPWITESSPPPLRGAFATLFQVLAVSGIAIMYVFGLLFHWRGIAVSGAVVCIVYVLLLFALPESPRWLLARGREADALRALRRLRTPTTDVDHVLLMMKADHAAEQEAAAGAGVGALLGSRPTRKAILISMCLMTFQNLSGVNAVFLFLGSPQPLVQATSVLAELRSHTNGAVCQGISCSRSSSRRTPPTSRPSRSAAGWWSSRSSRRG